MSPFYTKTLTAEINSPDGKQVFDFLRYATLDEGAFGRDASSAFLVDVNAEKRDTPGWADMLLSVRHGIVTTKRRDRFPVTFRLATDDERGRAFAEINELRPAYGTRTPTEDVRVIVAEVDRD